jgi:hypothetical protein
MSLKKYINKSNDKLELANYKLALVCQTVDIEKTIKLIDKQIKKIKLREANDIEIVETVGGGFEI